PKCDAVYWDKPVIEPCPKCNAPFLLEKTTKKGTTRHCATEGCDYSRELSVAPPPAEPTGEKRVSR
ncbi:MAG TPA: hypothetical protein VGJ55_00825, partial [Pyrinomonadaceae bacterium]